MFMGLSRLHWQLVCVAVICFQTTILDHSHGHAPGLSRHTNGTTPRATGVACAAQDDQHPVFIPSSYEHESHDPEIGIRCRHPPAAADEVASTPTTPSRRCANREEWQEPCRLWSGKPHHRYLSYRNLKPLGGLGVSLMRVAWALNRAISFDLEPVFVGPLCTAHGTGEFGAYMGLTHNPLLEIQDPGAFKAATHQRVPFPDGDSDAWFREQENRTSVVYEANAMKAQILHDWGIPVSKPNSNARVCPYARQALRNIYWSAPQIRGRCRAFLAEDLHAHTGAIAPEDSGYSCGQKRPWVIAVHVRRGDIINFRRGFRSIPHSYFSAAVNSVIRGIAVSNPAAHVSVLVFSEGPDTMKGLQLPDEDGKPLTWDIEHESCLDIGLNCSQKIFLNSSVFETFDCFAAADVLVGSESSFSQAAAAVSTNVKVMIRENQTEQDWVTLNFEAAVKSGAVSAEEQLAVNTAIADWWYCSGEVQRATGSNAETIAARRFYQTVDEGCRFPRDLDEETLTILQLVLPDDTLSMFCVTRGNRAFLWRLAKGFICFEVDGAKHGWSIRSSVVNLLCLARQSLLFFLNLSHTDCEVR